MNPTMESNQSELPGSWKSPKKKMSKCLYSRRFFNQKAPPLILHSI